MPSLVFTPAEKRPIQVSAYNTIRESRVGVMLHFDGSASDAGAKGWFKDPRCRASYHALVLDDGSWVQLAPWNTRAWHAGVCRPSSARLEYRDANSAFYGIAIATNEKTSVYALQLITTAYLVWFRFREEGWNLTETWRIVGHEDEAWERDRKMDPTGTDEKRPILRVQDVRDLVPLMEV